MRNPRVRPSKLCFNESSRWFWYMLKSKIHWSRWSQNFPLTLPFWSLASMFSVTFFFLPDAHPLEETLLYPQEAPTVRPMVVVLGDIELPWGMPFLIGQPHYFSALGSPGSQVLVRSAMLAQIVLVTGEGMKIKAQTISLRWELAWAASAARSGWLRSLA